VLLDNVPPARKTVVCFLLYLVFLISELPQLLFLGIVDQVNVV